MGDKRIMTVGFRDLERENELRSLYGEYKTLFIQAEEKLEEMRFFVAPMLEHRDALDHLMRYLEKSVVPDILQADENEQEREKKAREEAVDELKNAIDHEYRAYFDVADYVCITVRKRIADSLRHVPKWKIRSKWENYIEDKNRIREISDKIVKIRSDRKSRHESIEEYKKLMQEVFEVHDKFVGEIEPRLWGFPKQRNQKKDK